MNQKLQAIVPCFLDPLLCQLFFRNYAKHKHRYIDRLIILTSPHTSTYVIGDGRTNYVTEGLYEQQINDLKDLLKELNITNYILISDLPPNVEHGRVFSFALDYIRDPDYHTFFDEQDSYWINQDFGKIIEDLDKYDLIGGYKGNLPYLHDKEGVKKFNERYGTNHTHDMIPVMHLPQFLSSRVIKKLDVFDARSHGHHDFSVHIDIPTDAQRIFSLDTCQLLNLEVCKRTDKLKIYNAYPNSSTNERGWDLALGILHIGPSHIKYSDYLLLHSVGCRMTAFTGLWTPRVNCNEFKQLNFLESFHSSFGWDLRACFHYQSIERLPNFKYKDSHLNNFRLLRQAYREYFNYEMAPCDNGHYFSNHDCTDLLNHIL